VNDGNAIEEVDGGRDAIPAFLFGREADMVQHGTGQLGEEPSTSLSQESCLRVNVNLKRPAGCTASQALISLEICAE
jgi:hypothetical protein